MKKRFLAFMVCMAVLLASFTGCYSAKKDGPSTASSAQTAQLGSGSGTEGSVEIRTYVLPEENVRADSIYVPSPSTGGFWTWAVFTSKTIQAYDPVTRTTYYPCYQAGCKHNDASCSAYFGDISSLAEYRGNFYAMISYMILHRHLLRVLSPAARFESLQVGNRKMKTRNAGAACMDFLLERLIS